MKIKTFLMIKTLFATLLLLTFHSFYTIAQNPTEAFFGDRIRLVGKVIKEDLIEPVTNEIIKDALILKLPKKIKFKAKVPEVESDVFTDEIRIYGDLSKPINYSFLVDKYVIIEAEINYALSGHYPLPANIVSSFTEVITGAASNASTAPNIKINNFFINEGCKILSYCAHPTMSLDGYQCIVNEEDIVIDLYYTDYSHCQFRINRGIFVPFNSLTVNFDNTGTRPFLIVKPIAELAITFAESYDKKNEVESTLEDIFNKTTEQWTGADWSLCVLALCYKFR